VPNETQSPFITSGIRVGTPAVTTRGMDGDAMQQIAVLIDRVLTHHDDADTVAAVKADVKALADRFPLYRAVARV
jgi:glycine hydroxymethyltransferase